MLSHLIQGHQSSFDYLLIQSLPRQPFQKISGDHRLLCFSDQIYDTKIRDGQESAHEVILIMNFRWFVAHKAIFVEQQPA